MATKQRIDRNTLTEVLDRLQQARAEASHGVTANPAFIDMMVDEAHDLLLAFINDPAEDESFLQIENLPRGEIVVDDESPAEREYRRLVAEDELFDKAEIK